MNSLVDCLESLVQVLKPTPRVSCTDDEIKNYWPTGEIDETFGLGFSGFTTPTGTSITRASYTYTVTSPSYGTVTITSPSKINAGSLTKEDLEALMKTSIYNKTAIMPKMIRDTFFEDTPMLGYLRSGATLSAMAPRTNVRITGLEED